MEALLRDIYNSVKNDPELQSTLQIEALLNGSSDREDAVVDVSMIHGPTLAVYQRETMDRLESLVPQLACAAIPATAHALQEYRFVDHVDELRIGRFTRWICHVPPNPLYVHQYKPPKLNNGGILYHISIGDLGVYLHTYCFFTRRTIKYKFDNMWTFQKFNDPELAVLESRRRS